MKVYIILLSWLLVASVVSGHTTGNLTVMHGTSGLSFSLEGVRSTLRVHLAAGSKLRPFPCPHSCYKSDHAQVTLKKVRVGEATCVDVNWTNPDSNQTNCVELGQDYWYGGAEVKVQRWPIRDMDLPRIPYVTGDFGVGPIGGILEGLWMSSGGFVLFVDRETPLFLSFNHSGDGRMCLSASYDEYPYDGVSAVQRTSKVLRYTACSTANVREAYKLSRRLWIRAPTGTVDSSVLSKPIWSTWAKFKRFINQKKVLDYAQEIVDNGFEGSHLEIDDKWQICYGEMEFDRWRFPNASGMVEQLKELGFNVSLWVHPYASILCPSFYDPAHSKHLIKDAKHGRSLLCKWWDGLAGYLDYTDPGAGDYMVSKLESLRRMTGVQSFKFDSGEVSYITRGFGFHNQDLMAQPNVFSRLYAETAARMGNGVEVRVGYDAQHLPVFFRMLDKDSRWDTKNGLRTLIPSALFMSSIGYSFVLPDMIGGNGYLGLPNRELFVRWLQANVFMPVLQFSLTPWDYDQEVVNISLSMVRLHQQYVPLINQLVEECIRTGNPILRPLWWLDPTDPWALEEEQEFLLGDQVLVAPVVEEGALSRDVYLPVGNWEDQLNYGVMHRGPVWLRNYGATLDQLPYFVRKT